MAEKVIFILEMYYIKYCINCHKENISLMLFTQNNDIKYHKSLAKTQTAITCM